MRLFEEEFLAELDKPHRVYGTKELDVVTGTMAAPLITRMMEELHRQYPMITVHVHTIQNRFFGGNVGVTGLITATDIIDQCAGKLATKTLGIPACCGQNLHLYAQLLSQLLYRDIVKEGIFFLPQHHSRDAQRFCGKFACTLPAEEKIGRAHV